MSWEPPEAATATAWEPPEAQSWAPPEAVEAVAPSALPTEPAKFGSSNAAWPTAQYEPPAKTGTSEEDAAVVQRAQEEGKPVVMVDGKPAIGQTPAEQALSAGDQVVQGIERGLGGAGLRITEGVARLVGAKETADALGKDVAAMDSVLPKQTTAGKVGSGVGGAMALLSGGGLPGMLGIAGTQAVAGGYDAAYAKSLEEGNSEEIARIDAQQGAFKSTLMAVPELAAYWLLGAGAAKIVAPLLPQAGPLVKSIIGGAAATGANVATSTALHAIHGEPLFTPEGLATDATFGFLAHGLKVGKEAATSEAKVRELLKDAPIESLEAAALDPAFRKSSPYNPKFIDEEIAARKQTTESATTPATAAKAPPAESLPSPVEKTAALPEATAVAGPASRIAEPPESQLPPKSTPAPAGSAPLENEWTRATLPELVEKPTKVAPEAEAVTLGAVPPGFAQMAKTGELLVAGAKKVVSAIKDIPKFHDFRKSILNWSARNQAASGEVMKAAKDITTSVPDKTRREAITNWIQAGGDAAELGRRAASSTDLKLRKGYEAAQNLTPAEVALAGKIRQTYDILLQRAKDNGIEISEIENYVNQIWKRQPLKEFAASSNRKLSTSIRFAKQRYYDSFFHGEQSGLKPETKDIAKLLPIYMNEVNNAIASKQFVAELAKGKASDGRPLLAPRGGAQVIEGDKGGVQLVFTERATKDTADYKVLEQPALHRWKWAATDEAGVSTMVHGDLAVHPEAFSHLKNVLGQSAIREWYRSPSENPLTDIPKVAVKFLLDDVQQIAKATMLGFLSPFHQVQEGTHAIGHKVNPFGAIPKIDLTNPKQMDAAQHGLMLLPDRVSSQQFREGLDGSSRNIASNLIGLAGKPGAKIKEWADGYQNYLFHEYIPGLKLKTYDHILERNSKRYVDELAIGDVTIDQIKYLSAQQSNAAYGHLNYAEMGRNPTVQHLAQVFLLAPDFLEARGRFTGQAAKGTVTKAGREQLAAILTLAVTQYVTARILNQAVDGDPHWDHPFDVIAGNRKYTMRSVPEDIYKATKDTRRFISGRLSPLVGRGLLEGLSGVNYRGEPTTIAETFTNILSGAVPLTLQPATRGLSETGKDNPVSPIEQLIGSLGLHVSRFSPVSEIYHLSKEWTEKHGKEYGLEKRRAVFPVSKYQQLRYALEDADNEKVKDEVAQLLKDEKIDKTELAKRFKMSINHPFTGSRDTDDVFRKSLDERGKKVFEAAMKRRALLIDRFDAVK